MSVEWEAKKAEFETLDARELSGHFLPAIQKKAAGLKAGQGLRIIQGFEPVPLYAALRPMGFEHDTVKVSDDEYHVYFHKSGG